MARFRPLCKGICSIASGDIDGAWDLICLAVGFDTVRDNPATREINERRCRPSSVTAHPPGEGAWKLRDYRLKFSATWMCVRP